MRKSAIFGLCVAFAASAAGQTVPAPPTGGPIPTISLGAGSITLGESVQVMGVAPAGYTEVRIVWLLDTTSDGALDSMQSAAVAPTDGAGNYSTTITSDASWDGGVTVEVCAAVSGAEDADYACASLTIAAPVSGTIDGTVPIEAIESGGTVTISVVDPLSGEEVASTTTDTAAGGYFYVDVPPGSYNVVYGGGVNKAIATETGIKVSSSNISPTTSAYVACRSQGLDDVVDESFEWNDYVSWIDASPGKVRTLVYHGVSADKSISGSVYETTDEAIGYYITRTGASPLGGDVLSVELTANVQSIGALPYGVRFRIVDSTGAIAWPDDGSEGVVVRSEGLPDPEKFQTTVTDLDTTLVPGTYELQVVPILQLSDSTADLVECHGRTTKLYILEDFTETALGGNVSLSYDATKQVYNFSGYVPNFGGLLGHWFPSGDGSYDTCPWKNITYLGDLCSGYEAGIYINGSFSPEADIEMDSWQAELVAQILGRELFPQQVLDFASGFSVGYYGDVGEVVDPWDQAARSGDHRLFKYSNEWEVYNSVLVTFWGIVSVSASVTLGLDAALDLLMEQFIVRPETAATLTPIIEPSLKLSIWIDLLAIASAGADATANTYFDWPLTLRLDRDEQFSIEDGTVCIGLEALLDVWAKLAWKRYELGSYELFCVEKGDPGCFCPAAASGRGTAAGVTTNLPETMAAPSVATNPSGDRLVVWTENTNNLAQDDMVIRAMRWDPAFGTWMATETISVSDRAGFDPSVAYFGGLGEAVVVHTHNTLDEDVDPDPGTTAGRAQHLDIAYTLWDPSGGMWSAPTQLVVDDAASPMADGMPDVAGSSTGFTVAWTRDAGDGDISTRSDLDIAVRHYDAGGSWSDMVTLDATGAFASAGVSGTTPADYAVDVARYGDSVALAWTADSDADQSTNGNRRIAVAIGTRAAGNPEFFTWSIEVLPDGDGFPNWSLSGAQQPAIAIDPDDGSIYVLYTARSRDVGGLTEAGVGNTNVLWWAHRSTGGVWSGGPVADDTGGVGGQPVYAEKPELTVDTHGDIVVLMRRFGSLTEGTAGVNSGKHFFAGQLAVSLFDTTGGQISAPSFITFGENDDQQWQQHGAVDRSTGQLIVASVSRGASGVLSGSREIRLPCVGAIMLTPDADPVEVRVIDLGADLLAEQDVQLSQAHAPVGSSVTVTTTVRNVGMGDSSAIRVQVYENADCSGTAVHEEDVPVSLGFQETYNYQYAVTRTAGDQWLCTRAFDPDENTAAECPDNDSASVNVGAMPAPLAISAQVSTTDVDAIELNVVEPGVVGVSGYRFLRTTDPVVGPWDNVGESTLTTWSDKKVTRGVIYHYKARAYDAAGATSADSDVVSASLSAVKQAHRLVGDGAYEDPTAWTDGVLPETGDEVRIDLPGAYVVQATSDVVTGSVFVGDGAMSPIELHLAGANLTVGRPSTVLAGATLRLSGAAVDVGQAFLEIDGTLVSEGGGNSISYTLPHHDGIISFGSMTMPHHDGIIAIMGGTEFPLSGLSLGDGLENHGTVRLQSTALNEPAVLDIETGTLSIEQNPAPDPAGALEVLAGPGMNYIRAAHIVNRGSMIFQGDTEITPFNPAAIGRYDNFNTFATAGGSVTINAPASGSQVTNWHQLTVGGGDSLTVTGAALKNFATMQLGAGAGLTLDSTFTQRGSNASLTVAGGTLVAYEWDLLGGTLNGTGTITGNVSFGVGVAAPTFTVRPGMSAGQMTFGGALSFGGYANYDCEVGGLTPGTEHDYVYTTATASLDGILTVRLINGYAPVHGETVTILQADGGITGQFAAIDRSNLPGGTSVDVLYTSTAVQLQFDLVNASCNSDEECNDFNDCTTEYCDINTADCISSFVPVGTVCDSQVNNECTDPDTCDGAGVCLPNHAPDGTTCQSTETCLDGECAPPTHQVVALPEGTNVGSDAECAFADGSTVYAAGNVIDASLVDHAAVWESTDAGASFALVELPEAASGPSGVKSITCDAGGICFAVGFDGATQQPAAWRRDGSGTWSSETVPLTGGATAGILMDGALQLTTGDLIVAGWFVDGGGAQKAAYWTRAGGTGAWSVSTLPDLGGNAMALVLNLELDDGGWTFAGGVEDAGGRMVPAIWVEGPPASGLFTVELPYLVPAGTSGIINAFEYDGMGRIWVAAGEITLINGSTRGVVWEIQSLNLYDERDLWVLPPQIGYTDSRANGLHNMGASRTIYGQSWSSLAIAGTSGPRPSTHWRDDGGGRTRGDGSTTLENLPPGCYAEREGAARDPRQRLGGPAQGRAIRLECPPPATASSGTATTHAAYAALTMAASYKYWKDPVSGNWSDATKWVDALGNSVAAAPGPGEQAYITVDGNYTVTLDTNTATAGLTVGGVAGTQTLSMSTRTLGLGGLSVIGSNGILTLANSSALTGAGPVENSGTINMIGANSVDTDVINSGLLFSLGIDNNLNGVLSNLAQGILHVTFNGADTGKLTIANGFTNEGLIELTSQDNSAASSSLWVSTGILHNAGTIRTSFGRGGNPRVITSDIVNVGTIDLDYGTDLHALAALFDTTDGVLDVADGVVLRMYGTGTQFGAGTVLAGTGTVRLYGTHVLTLNAPYTHQPGGAGVQLDLLGDVTIDGPGSLTNEGTLTLTDADVVNADVVNSSLLISLGIDNRINGSFTNPSSGNLRVSFDGAAVGMLTIANGFTNEGLIELTSQNNTQASSHLSVPTGALLNNGTIRTLVGWGGYPRVITADLVNAGSLDFDYAVDLHTVTAPFDTTSGALDVADGVLLRIYATETDFGLGTVLTGTGAIRFPVANVLNLHAPYTHQPGGVGVQFELIGDVTINGPGSLTNEGTLTLTDTDVVNADVVNSSLLISLGIDNRINGSFSNASGGDLRVTFDGVDVGKLTIANGFTNDGLIELTSQDNSQASSHLSVLAGTLTNNGTIQALVGRGGYPRAITADLVNAGTFDIDHPVNLSQTGSGHVIGGLVDVVASTTLTVNASTVLLAGVTMTGGGTLILNGASELYGHGDLGVNLIINSGGTISPGDPPGAVAGTSSEIGVLNIDGDLMLSGNTTMTVQLGGETPGTEHDQINVTGLATLSGALNVELLNGHIPTPSSSIYQILTYGSRNWEFLDGIFGLAICPDLDLVPIFTTTELTLAATGSLSEACLCALDPNFHIVPPSWPNPVYGSFFSYQLLAACGTEPYTWSVTGGALPDGLSLTPDGLLSGTPTRPGEFSFSVTAYDTASALATAELGLTVFATQPQQDIEITIGAPRMVPGRQLELQVMVRNLGEGASRASLLTAFLEPWFHYVEASPAPVAVQTSTGVPDWFPRRSTIEWFVSPIPSGSFHLASYTVDLDTKVPIGFFVGWTALFVPTPDPTWVLERDGIIARDEGCDVACVGDLVVDDAGCSADPLACLIDRISTDADCTACYSSTPPNLPQQYLVSFEDESLMAVTKCCCVSSTVGTAVTYSCSSLFPFGCGGLSNEACCSSNYAGTYKDETTCGGSGGGTGTTPASVSEDPNDKLVVGGAFVRTDTPLLYTVEFENVGNAEALDVFVRDVLDTNLDDTTLQILSPDGSYNGGSRLLQWDLLGINLQPGAGDGVSAVIQPVVGTPSGTQIFNDAEIQFESLTPIVTNEVVNTVDEIPPVCTMDALPATSPPWISLSWSGTDAVGEIEAYAVFVSVDGGPFEFLGPTSETSAVYVGEVGRTYGFLCTASDTAGNVEVQAPIAETTTSVVAASDATLPDLIVDAVWSPTCVPWQLISGQATDPNGGDAISGVADVHVNGVSAVFDDTTGQFVRAAALVPGVNDIVISAVDYAGNETLAFAQIDLDAVPPDVTCPGESYVVSEDGVGAPLPDVTGGAAATDDCGFAPSLSQDPPAGTVVGLGAQLVTVIATDLAGNVNQCVAQVNVTPAPPAGDPTGVGRKNRYFTIVPGNAGAQTAIRVIPRVLTGHESAQGSILWVGPPDQYPEEDASQPGRTFTGAALSCQPHFQRWDLVGEVQVFGGEIFPEAQFDVQVIFQAAGSLVDEANYSPPLVVTTGVWGDIVPLYEGDDPGAPQPDFNDIASVVSKFIGDPAAPIKARAQLQPNTAIPQRAISFKDIAAAVSAFVGDGYPYSGPCTCPSSVTCFATLCTGDLECGAGYCIDGGCTDACGRCTP